MRRHRDPRLPGGQRTRGREHSSRCLRQSQAYHVPARAITQSGGPLFVGYSPHNANISNIKGKKCRQEATIRTPGELP